MEIENLFRYAALAVGLKPSANQGKARLRGLWRIMYSKTIHPRLCEATPACTGYGGLCIQRPYTLGYARRRSPARAMADYVFKDHTPSAMRGDARLRGRERIICSKTISPPEAHDETMERSNQARVNVSENCYNPACALCRRAHGD